MSVKIANLVDLIVDNIEGGYYHPDMKSKLRNGDAMLDSGETMFGLDRKYGGTLNTGAAGVKFWNLIDSYYSTHHSDTAYYNDKADGKRVPAAVGKNLKAYLTEIMSAQLNNLSEKFMSEGVRKIVFKNPALVLQFLYLCWNGSGNFQNCANALNEAYRKGIANAEQYWQIIQAYRRNKNAHYAKGADKLENLKSKADGSSSAGWIVAALAAAGLLWWLSKK